MEDSKAAAAAVDGASAEAGAAAAAEGSTYSAEFVKKILSEKKEVEAKLRKREDAEKKAKDAKDLEDGKAKELLEAAQKRIGELESLEEELKAFRKEAQDRRKALLEELPKDKRELYADASEAVIRDAVETHKTLKGETTEARKAGRSGEGKKYEDYTSTERLALKSENPALYRTLFSAWYKSKNGSDPPANLLK